MGLPTASGSNTNSSPPAVKRKTPNMEQQLNVPSTKGHRPWKKPKDKPSSGIRGVSSFKPSWEQRLKQREKRKALMAVVTAAREADKATKEAERKRRAEKKKRKEENQLRSAQKVVITNPKKLAKMSKKQFLRTVHKK